MRAIPHGAHGMYWCLPEIPSHSQHFSGRLQPLKASAPSPHCCRMLVHIDGREGGKDSGQETKEQVGSRQHPAASWHCGAPHPPGLHRGHPATGKQRMEAATTRILPVGPARLSEEGASSHR